MRSRQSHSAIRAISAVAVCGVAVATAAIICVLSVFNGFREIIGDRLDSLAPDVMVTPAKGKVFADADSLATVLKDVKGVATATPSLTDNALALYRGHEMPVTLKGVDFTAWRRVTAIDSIIVDGGKVPSQPEDAEGYPQAVFSIGAAAQLGLSPEAARVLLFSPRRVGRVNLANPAGSFVADSVSVAAIYQADQSDYDGNMVVAGLDAVRTLFQYDGAEASAVEVAAAPGTTPETLAARITDRLGDPSRYVVRDRARQQEVNFRMVSIEKWVTFLLLFFILVIASFNIVSTLCMAVIEKDRSMQTMRALGMTRRAVGRVFWWESIYVTLAGGLAGITIGVALCLLQQRFGLIKLAADPGELIVSAYPVRLLGRDILATLVPVGAVGLLTAAVASLFARQRCR